MEKKILKTALKNVVRLNVRAAVALIPDVYAFVVDDEILQKFMS